MRKIIALLVILALTIGCDDPLGSSSVYVKYKITGTANTVNITYENSDGGTSQESDVSVPWAYTFTGYSGDFVYTSAQNQGETGSVIVTIFADNEIFKQSTSTGAYVIASAYETL